MTPHRRRQRPDPPQRSPADVGPIIDLRTPKSAKPEFPTLFSSRPVEGVPPGAGCGIRWCDDDAAQAVGRVGVRVPDPAGRCPGHDRDPDRALDAGGPGRAHNYYSAQGEALGRWVGSGLVGIRRLAVGDPLTAEQMRHLFGAGQDPLTGEALGAAYRVHGESAGERAGFEAEVTRRPPPVTPDARLRAPGGHETATIRSAEQEADLTGTRMGRNRPRKPCGPAGLPPADPRSHAWSLPSSSDTYLTRIDAAGLPKRQSCRSGA